MTDEQLLEQRVEHRPKGPTCADCRHLGEPIWITDGHNARRCRRRCPFAPRGFTAPDWPACPLLQRKDAA